MKSAYGVISALSLSVDVGVRSVSDYQGSRVRMAQIVNDELYLIRERIGSDFEKQFYSFKKASVQRRNYDGDRY